MTTPTDKEQRMSIWDMFRFRWKVDTEKVTSKQSLIQEARKAKGYRKYERVKGRDQNIIKYVQKSDFWQKSKYEDRHDFLYTKREWRPEQESMLKELSKSYRGKELVSEFNKRTHQNRSYMAVMVRKSRLKK